MSIAARRVPLIYAEMPTTSLGTRIGFLIAAAVYVGVLQVLYITVVSPIWAYAGYEFIPPSIESWVAFTILSLVPSLWVPLELNRPSQWLYFYLNVAVYIPTCFVPLFAGLSVPSSPDALLFFVSMLAGMAILGVACVATRKRLQRPELPRLQFWLGIAALLIFAYGVTLVTFGSSLSLEALSLETEAVRDQRFQGSEKSSALVGYCLNLPAWAINPFLMAYGLCRRKPLWFALGAGGQLYLFSVNAVRGVIATVPLMLAMYFFMRIRIKSPIGAIFMWSLAGAVVLATAICFVAPRDVRIQISAAVMRPILSPAATAGLYYNFFSHNPKTNFSHVKGIGSLVDPVYASESIGRVVGRGVGSPENCIVAGLWADGFASYGFPGMILVSVFAACFFYCMDSALGTINSRFAVLAIGPQALNIADLPLQTTLLGGGLALVVLLIYLGPWQQEGLSN